MTPGTLPLDVHSIRMYVARAKVGFRGTTAIAVVFALASAVWISQSGDPEPWMQHSQQNIRNTQVTLVRVTSTKPGTQETSLNTNSSSVGQQVTASAAKPPQPASKATPPTQSATQATSQSQPTSARHSQSRLRVALMPTTLDSMVSESSRDATTTSTMTHSPTTPQSAPQSVPRSSVVAELSEVREPPKVMRPSEAAAVRADNAPNQSPRDRSTPSTSSSLAPNLSSPALQEARRFTAMTTVLPSTLKRQKSALVRVDQSPAAVQVVAQPVNVEAQPVNIEVQPVNVEAQPQIHRAPQPEVSPPTTAQFSNTSGLQGSGGGPSGGSPRDGSPPTRTTAQPRPATAPPLESMEDFRRSMGFTPLDRTRLKSRAEGTGSPVIPEVNAGREIIYHPTLDERELPNRLKKYIEEVDKIINRRWFALDLSPHQRALGLQGQTTVEFVILANGQVSAIDTTILSGNTDIDSMAYNAIPKRLPRLPRVAGIDRLHRKITFHYANPFSRPSSTPATSTP